MARSIRFTPEAWGDYIYWQGQDKKTLKRINVLIEAAARDPFAVDVNNYDSGRIVIYSAIE